jgi:DHA2 family multidrug resistance protein
MLGISVLCFILFLAWERDEPHPIVDLSLFGHRNFLIGTVSSAIFYMTFLISAVIYPIWMQTSMGYTASWAGLISAPAGIAPLILMPLLGQRIQHWDARWMVTAGTFLLIFAFYLHTQLSTDSPAWYLAMIRFVIGMGMPFAMMPLMMITLVGLPAEKMASATGIFNFVRMLAASLGTAVGVTLWDQRAIYHRSRLVEDISTDSPQFQQAMALLTARLPDPQSALAALDGMVKIQARTLAMLDVYYLCAAGVVVVAIIAWFLPAHATAREPVH